MKKVILIVILFLTNSLLIYSQIIVSIADDISFLDKNTIVYTQYDSYIVMHNLITAKDSILELENKRIVNSRYLSDVNYFLISTKDSSLFLIDNYNKQIKSSIKHERELSLLTSSKKGEYIFTFSNMPYQELICYDIDFNKVWSIKNPHSKVKIISFIYGLTDIKYNNEKNVLATCSSDKDIKLWNVTDGKLIKSLIGHKKAINDMSFSSDGKYLASGGKDKTCKIWDIESGKVIHSFKSKNIITSLDFSPDGEKVLFGTNDDYFEIWDIKKGIRIYKSEEIYDYKDMPLLEIRYSPDRKYIFARNGNFIRIWETKKYTKFRDL